MIEKNLMNFLRFRPLPLNDKDISNYEKKYGRNLPPIFRAFSSVFEPFIMGGLFFDKKSGELETFVSDIYCKEEKQYYEYDDDVMSFQEFMEPEEILRFDRNYLGWKGDVLFIANHGYFGGLMVGISEDNMDKIYHSAGTTEVEFVANNIFEYLSKIRFVQVFFDFPNLKLNSLYKNWGEDFWRIREDDNT
jgi:hypothetical protein